MSIGDKLRAARETKCLSIKDLSESTHVDENIIRDLENDDFHAIKASIYGQGFLRLCANRLGLDPVPLLEEFKRTYNAGMVAPSESMVGNYRAQEALYKERSADSRLFSPDALQQPEPDSEPHPLPPSPEVPIQVTVQLDQPKPKPQPVAPAPAPVAISPVPPVVPAPPTPAAPVSPAPVPVKETTIVVEPVSSSPGVADDFRALFAGRGQTPAPTPFDAAMARPADPPAPPAPSDEDENSLFAQAGRKPRPIPVDPEDNQPRPMTGIFVPPARRKEMERASAAVEERAPAAPAPAPAPVAPAPVPEEKPEKPATVKVQTEKPPRTGPTVGERLAKACGQGARTTGKALGVALAAAGHGLLLALAAAGRGLLAALRFLGHWLAIAGAAIGRGLAALGRFLLRNIRSVAMVGAAVLVVLLGVWAILGIRKVIVESHRPHVVVVQSPVADKDSPVELALPPPALYAD